MYYNFYGPIVDLGKCYKTKKSIPFLESISTHTADQAHKSSFQLFKVLISLKYWFFPAADKGKYE